MLLLVTDATLLQAIVVNGDKFVDDLGCCGCCCCCCLLLSLCEADDKDEDDEVDGNDKEVDADAADAEERNCGDLTVEVAVEGGVGPAFVVATTLIPNSFSRARA